jgi:upstream activation factor subunit UAF30
MDLDEAALSAAIARALRRPDIDLDAVSAKEVRTMLVQAGDLSEEDAQRWRKEIKTMVGEVFWLVKDEKAALANANGAAERGRELGPEQEVVEASEAGEDDGDADADADADGDEVEEEPSEEEEEVKPKKKPTKAKSKSKGMTDEELAKKLSKEINGGSRTTRGGGSTKAAKGGAKGAKRKKKSADVVDSDGEGEDGKPAKKKRKGGGGFQKEFTLRYGIPHSCSFVQALMLGMQR